MNDDREADWQRVWKCALADNTINHGIIAELTGTDPWTVSELVNEHHKQWKTHPLWTESWGTPVVTEGTNTVGWTPEVILARKRKRN